MTHSHRPRDSTEAEDRLFRLIEQLPDEGERQSQTDMIAFMLVLKDEATAAGDVVGVQKALEFLIDEERRVIDKLAELRRLSKQKRREAFHLVVQVSIPAAAIILAGFWFH